MKIYHNPKCSKSRETLELLRQNGKPFEIIEYLKENPSVEELKEIIKKLSLPITSIIRFKEKLALDLKINAQDKRSENEWLTILEENPSLIERPIVVSINKAVIGRPPENVKELF